MDVPNLLTGGRIRVELEHRLMARRRDDPEVGGQRVDMELVPCVSFYVEGEKRWPRKATIGPIVATEAKGVGECDYADLLEAAARIMRTQLENQ
jgi:hypothetical protein